MVGRLSGTSLWVVGRSSRKSLRHVAGMPAHTTPLPSMPQPARAGQLPRLVSIEAVAEHLGVSVRHVRRLVYERRIPYVKWGHLVRFDVDDVNAWVAGSRIAVVDLSDSQGRR